MPLLADSNPSQFVVDGKWVTDPTAPQEDDGHHNINNILKPEDIKKHSSPAAGGVAAGGIGAGIGAGGIGAALLSSVHPNSSSAKLAGNVPKEADKAGPSTDEPSSAVPPTERNPSPPGAFPETPFHEAESFAVNPIPASSGASNPVSVPAGDKLPDHEAVTGNTTKSKVTGSKEDYEKDASSALPEEKSYGISPIPASSGTGNPISLPAGEKLPDHKSITGNTIGSQVTTSKEDYEKDASSDFPEKSYGVDPIPASAGIGNPISVPARDSVKQHKNLLARSVDETATTSKEDYEKAGSAAMPVGAAGAGTAEPSESAFSVPDKTKDMIPESSLPMSGGLKDTIGAGPFVQSSGPGTTTAALAGQVPLEPKSKAFVVEDKTPSTSDPSPFLQSSGPGTTTAALAGQVPLESNTLSASGASPFTQSSGAGTTTAALAGQVPLEPKSEATVLDDEKPSATLTGPAPDVPEVVKESLSQAHQSPEAAASPEAVEEKKEAERELLQQVKPTDAVGEPAPTLAAATSPTAPAATGTTDSKAPEAPTKPGALGDVSPVGTEANATAPAPSSPIVTTGAAESTTSAVSTPQKPTTPASSAASSPADPNGTKDKKKKKRQSFFGKLKDKLKG
jgi:hypothetical protein